VETHHSFPRSCLLHAGRFHPFIGHEGPYVQYRYSSTLFLTSALEGGEGSAPRPGRTLPPGKTRYLLYRRLGGPQGQSGLVRKISPPPGFDPRTVQLVGSYRLRYPAHFTTCSCQYKPLSVTMETQDGVPFVVEIKFPISNSRKSVEWKRR
jgi:hypothetical protein